MVTSLYVDANRRYLINGKHATASLVISVSSRIPDLEAGSGI